MSDRRSSQNVLPAVLTADDTLEWVLEKTWAALSTPSHAKNALYDQIFPDENALWHYATSTSISFAPGLLEVVQSASAPGIDFFKGLPDARLVENNKRWGVYAIVFTKRGERTLLYIGVGTGVNGGIRSRIGDYINKSSNLAPQVYQAFRDGYKIAHTGLLASFPTPVDSNPRFRLLAYALESTFHNVFNSFKPRTNSKPRYNAHISPWATDSFQHDGINSHDPLIDVVPGDFQLTPEQLHATAERRKAHTKAYHKRYASQHRQNVRNFRTRKGTCRPCGSKADYDHFKHAAHKRRMERLASGKRWPFWCELCRTGKDVPSGMEWHEKTKAHKKRASNKDSPRVAQEELFREYGPPKDDAESPDAVSMDVEGADSDNAEYDDVEDEDEDMDMDVDLEVSDHTEDEADDDEDEANGEENCDMEVDAVNSPSDYDPSDDVLSDDESAEDDVLACDIRKELQNPPWSDDSDADVEAMEEEDEEPATSTGPGKGLFTSQPAAPHTSRVRKELKSCKACGTSCNQIGMAAHLQTKTHKLRMERIASGEMYKFWCGKCVYGTDNSELFHHHTRKTVRHMERADDPDVRVIKQEEVFNAYNTTATGSEDKEVDEDEVSAAEPEQEALLEQELGPESCKSCGLLFGGRTPDEHMDSKLHIARMERIASGILYKYWCRVCVYGTDHLSHYSRHMDSEKHKERARKQGFGITQEVLFNSVLASTEFGDQDMQEGSKSEGEEADDAEDIDAQLAALLPSDESGSEDAYIEGDDEGAENVDQEELFTSTTETGSEAVAISNDEIIQVDSSYAKLCAMERKINDLMRKYDQLETRNKTLELEMRSIKQQQTAMRSEQQADLAEVSAGLSSVLASMDSDSETETETESESEPVTPRTSQRAQRARARREVIMIDDDDETVMKKLPPVIQDSDYEDSL